ncbi:MAG: type I restriction enzyme HsdR N-terminal domain-containing protein, partial [Duncaniella sp.]|nr:type I restriction enzyme HsdR N-terminal domain-containing protein [Duncaniella sp.]
MKYARTTDEKAYQDFLKEILFENCFGWHNSNIVEQHSITLGSTQRLIPDLIVYKNNTAQFIIEVKHPFHTRRHDDIEQLASYMKQLEVNTGIYIGSAIEVYYKKLGNGSYPDLILSTTFKPDDPKGEEFAHLFSESSFSLEKIEQLYQKYIEEKEANEETHEIIKQLCTQDTID